MRGGLREEAAIVPIRPSAIPNRNRNHFLSRREDGCGFCFSMQHVRRAQASIDAPDTRERRSSDARPCRARHSRCGMHGGRRFSAGHVSPAGAIAGTRLLAEQRDRHPEGTAPTNDAQQADSASVRFHSHLAKRQPEPGRTGRDGPVRLRLTEFLEDLLMVFGRDPQASPKRRVASDVPSRLEIQIDATASTRMMVPTGLTPTSPPRPFRRLATPSAQPDRIVSPTAPANPALQRASRPLEALTSAPYGEVAGS